jgi:hypothetical protein
MADGKRKQTREEEIAEIMRTTSLDRGYAEEAVAWNHGEPVYGIETLHPLTPEQRRAIGLDRPAEEVSKELGEWGPEDEIVEIEEAELLADLGVIVAAKAAGR